LYRGFDIGTAKPTLDARQGIRHHLIDVLEPGAVYSAGDYAREGRAAVAKVTSRGRVPIVVGGTGFYLRAMLEGLFEGPSRDEPFRRRLGHREQRRPGSLHRILGRLDPAAAARIHSNDEQKLLRAVEVRLLAGEPMSDLHGERRVPLSGYRVI